MLTGQCVNAQIRVWMRMHGILVGTLHVTNLGQSNCQWCIGNVSLTTSNQVISAFCQSPKISMELYDPSMNVLIYHITHT